MGHSREAPVPLCGWRLTAAVYNLPRSYLWDGRAEVPGRSSLSGDLQIVPRLVIDGGFDSVDYETRTDLFRRRA